MYFICIRHTLILLLQLKKEKEKKYLNQKYIKDSICTGICGKPQTPVAQNSV